jgi:hypothetical protein
MTTLMRAFRRRRLKRRKELVLDLDLHLISNSRSSLTLSVSLAPSLILHQDTEELAHKIVQASGNGVELGEINWA